MGLKEAHVFGLWGETGENRKIRRTVTLHTDKPQVQTRDWTFTVRHHCWPLNHCVAQLPFSFKVLLEFLKTLKKDWKNFGSQRYRMRSSAVIEPLCSQTLSWGSVFSWTGLESGTVEERGLEEFSAPTAGILFYKQTRVDILKDWILISSNGRTNFHPHTPHIYSWKRNLLLL